MIVEDCSKWSNFDANLCFSLGSVKDHVSMLEIMQI